MEDFNLLLPGFVTQCKEFRTLLLPIAYLFLVGSMIATLVAVNRSGRVILHMFGKTVVCIILLVKLADWTDLITNTTNTTVKDVLKADPSSVNTQYKNMLQAQKSTSNKQGWYDRLFDFSNRVFESMVSAILWTIGMLASIIIFYAYIIQNCILYFGYALSPVFIGFLATHSMGRVGFNYLIGLVGVAIWPLGWGVASLLTEALLKFSTDQSFLIDQTVTGAAAYGFQNFIGVALLGVWIIFSTIAAPVIIQKVIVSGAQIGAELISGAATAGTAALVQGSLAAVTHGARGGVAGLVTGVAAGLGAAGTALIGSSISGQSHSPTAGLFSAVGRPRGGGGGNDKSSSKKQPVLQASAGGSQPPPPASPPSQPPPAPPTDTPPQPPIQPMPPAPKPSFADISGDNAVQALIQSSKNPHS